MTAGAIISDNLARSWVVAIDPSAAVMADHQPGGVPLLGTVAQLEQLARCGAELMGDQHLTAFSNILIEAPFLIADGKPANITVSIVAHPDRTTQSAVICSGCDGQTTTHLRATLSYSSTWERGDNVSLPDPPARSVSQAQIYRCYFHGPAFQVIGRAARVGEQTGWT